MVHFGAENGRQHLSVLAIVKKKFKLGAELPPFRRPKRSDSCRIRMSRALVMWQFESNPSMFGQFRGDFRKFPVFGPEDAISGK